MLILCLKIFLVRIVDVSMGTVRTITMVKGKKLMASIIGFMEVLIWFLIAKEALNTSESSIWIAIAYSLGFATGTFVGGFISGRFIKGTLSVQIVVDKGDETLIKELRKNGYAVSVMDVRGHDENNKKIMLFLEINNQRLENLKKLVKQYEEKAFIVVNETRYVQNGYFK